MLVFRKILFTYEMDDPLVKSQDMLHIRFEWMNKYHLNIQLTKEINTKCKFILKFQSDTSTMSSLGIYI